MENQTSERRSFIKLTAMGIGGAIAAPAFALASETTIPNTTTASGKKLNVVCVGAHPGDPEFGCGGTMARYSAAGHNVTFLYLTRGEAYDNTKTYAECAALRTKEAEVACDILGTKPLFAGQVDGNTVLSKDKSEDLTKLLLAEKPDLVFTQWPVDSHPDHQVTGLLALTAWVKSGQQFNLYFYEVNTGTETMAFTPTDFVDITAVRDKKMGAMFAHRSQDPDGTYNGFFKPLEDFRGLQAGVKAAEAFIHFKAKAEQALITGL